MLGKFFKGGSKPQNPEEELIPVPVPALVAVLLNQENEKNYPLTEKEVLEVRDNAACVMMPVSAISKMAESRGYEDLDPEYVWEQWQKARRELINGENS